MPIYLRHKTYSHKVDAGRVWDKIALNGKIVKPSTSLIDFFVSYKVDATIQ